MPEYLAPAVYIEEIERGPKPIEGVATSIVAFLGETERGPTMPAFVSSYGEYLRQFGGPWKEGQFLPYAVSAFFENGGTMAYVARIVAHGSDTQVTPVGDLPLRPVGPGGWANRVMVKVTPSTTQASPKPGADKVPIGYRIRAAYWSALPDGSDPDMKDPFPDLKPGEFPEPLTYPPNYVEDFDDVVVNDERSLNHYSKTVNGSSTLFTVDFSQTALPTDPPSGTETENLVGTEGGAPTAEDYSWVDETTQDDPQKRTGLQALLLDPYRAVSLLYAPAAASNEGIARKLIAHCENHPFVFSVIDAGPATAFTALDPRGAIQDTKHAAYYYPWITISDPSTGARRDIPPGGAVLGIYARSDAGRGVFKAPANEVVRGAIDLKYKIDQSGQGVLNPRGVNVIRQFPGRGILLWGARTMSSDSLWKYVSVRRLFNFIESSIYEGTQWVVFEPNDQRLWARVVDTIRLFLRQQWREGALMGTTEAEAFRIACDRSTMTQNDILNGRLICEIGIAPVRPAEFVVFRIFQLTNEAQA